MQVSRTFRQEVDVSGLGVLATGHPSGHVYFWRHRRAMGILQPSLCAPCISLHSDGNPWRIVSSSRGVRCIRCWHLPDEPGGSGHSSCSSAAPARASNGHSDPVSGMWFLGVASHEGAVHIWKVPAHYDLSGADKIGSDSATRQRSARLQKAGMRMHARHAYAGCAGVRRVASVWVPRLPRAAARSPVRAFDVAAAGRGLRLAVGTYDGSLWACRLDEFPSADTSVRLVGYGDPMSFWNRVRAHVLCSGWSLQSLACSVCPDERFWLGDPSVGFMATPDSALVSTTVYDACEGQRGSSFSPKLTGWPCRLASVHRTQIRLYCATMSFQDTAQEIQTLYVPAELSTISAECSAASIFIVHH